MAVFFFFSRYAVVVCSVVNVASVRSRESLQSCRPPHALIPAPDPTPKMRGSKIDLCFYLHTQTAVVMAMKGDREREADGI